MLLVLLIINRFITKTHDPLTELHTHYSQDFKWYLVVTSKGVKVSPFDINVYMCICVRDLVNPQYTKEFKKK